MVLSYFTMDVVLRPTTVKRSSPVVLPQRYNSFWYNKNLRVHVCVRAVFDMMYLYIQR